MVFLKAIGSDQKQSASKLVSAILFISLLSFPRSSNESVWATIHTQTYEDNKTCGEVTRSLIYQKVVFATHSTISLVSPLRRAHANSS